MHMDAWTFVWLMVFLKIPIVALFLLVRWAVHQTPDDAAGATTAASARARVRCTPATTRARGPHAPPRARTAIPRRRAPARAARRGRPRRLIRAERVVRARARARIAPMSASPPASVLSDGTIARLVREGRIRIDPWDEGLVQPASVDLRLGDSFRVFHNHKITAIDLREPAARADRAGDAPAGTSRS